MGARAGLDRVQVIEVAAVIADESGADGLTLAALATRLGVRSQSLYAHVDGLDGLRRDLAVRGQEELASRLGSAVMGRAGASALRALAAAYADFAAERPGLYTCALKAPLGDETLEASAEAASEPWRATLWSFGLSTTENRALPPRALGRASRVRHLARRRSHDPCREHRPQLHDDGRRVRRRADRAADCVACDQRVIRVVVTSRPRHRTPAEPRFDQDNAPSGRIQAAGVADSRSGILGDGVHVVDGDGTQRREGPVERRS